MMSRSFKVGVDSYSLHPLRLTPFELMDWVQAHGGEGVQFSEVNLPPRRRLDKAFLRDLAQYAREKRLYLEWGGGQHIPFDLRTGRPVDIFKVNRRAAEQARLLGLRAIRSCSGGLMRWTEDSLPTGVFLQAMAQDLLKQKQMFGDLGIALAIETHFEFTTFELLRLFNSCAVRPGEYLGICLDTMNLLTMLEDPVAATNRVLPWVVMTHIKDGGILLTENGLLSFPVEAGKGIIDLEEILRLLSTLDRPVHLSLEDHGGEFLMPVFNRAFLLKFPDLTVMEFARLFALTRESRKLFDQGKLTAVERRDWPEVCEKRVRNGLRHLKEMAG
ncbi:MAG: TIM barrel protein [Candidatus Aminicenantales bacterium]